MNAIRRVDHRQTFIVSACLCAFVIGFLDLARWSGSCADEVDSVPAKTAADAAAPDDKAAAKKITPDRFHEVDDAARVMVLLIVACGLGSVVLLSMIVLGARRMRRLTRSPSLKSKYDELEYLRAKYRREVAGIDPPPPNREARQ